MKTSTAWIAATVLGAGLFLVARQPVAKASTPLPFLPIAKQVQVGDALYNVVALGGGTFEVSDARNLANHLVFSIDRGPLLRTGDTTSIERDMQRFPKDLFAA